MAEPGLELKPAAYCSLCSALNLALKNVSDSHCCGGIRRNGMACPVSLGSVGKRGKTLEVVLSLHGQSHASFGSGLQSLQVLQGKQQAAVPWR